MSSYVMAWSIGLTICAVFVCAWIITAMLIRAREERREHEEYVRMRTIERRNGNGN